MKRLEELGFSGQVDLGEGQFLGRVAADYGIQFEIWAERGSRRAIVPGKHRNALSPAVGDFVVLDAGDDDMWLIRTVLPRRTALIRQAAGRRTKAQVIGANLDTVFVVTSMNQEFNARRLERYMTAIERSGASAVIVLNKADLADDVDLYVEQARQVAPDVEVVSMTALGAQDVRAKLQRWLQPTKTVAFVGSSGVGKSTIINGLLGAQHQRVSDIREDDDEGRHTTTHRQIFEIKGAGMLLDTPGMREVQLWGDEDDADDAFPEVEDLAAACRFSDCEHDSEPGCAVQAAIEAGDVSVGRVNAWRALKAELAYHARKTDVAAQLEEKRRVKSMKAGSRKTQKMNSRKKGS